MSQLASEFADVIALILDSAHDEAGLSTVKIGRGTMFDTRTSQVFLGTEARERTRSGRRWRIIQFAAAGTRRRRT